MKKPKKNKQKKRIAIAIIAALCISHFARHSDSWIRDRVVKLVSPEGSCSGEQVRATSGTDYILTAGHCRGLEVNGSIEAITESGKHIMRRVVAEDTKSDLLLLEGLPGLKGLSIAASSAPKDEIRTFTHGHGMDTYKTEGALIQDEQIMIPLSMISSEEEAAKCVGDKFAVVPTLFGAYCVIKVTETVTTAMIIPGSSGGPCVDGSGELVGVASATDGRGLNYLVRLSDIKAFLASY